MAQEVKSCHSIHLLPLWHHKNINSPKFHLFPSGSLTEPIYIVVGKHCGRQFLNKARLWVKWTVHYLHCEEFEKITWQENKEGSLERLNKRNRPPLESIGSGRMTQTWAGESALNKSAICLSLVSMPSIMQSSGGSSVLWRGGPASYQWDAKCTGSCIVNMWPCA